MYEVARVRGVAEETLESKRGHGHRASAMESLGRVEQGLEKPHGLQMACAFGARIASPRTRSTLGTGCRTKCPAAFTLTLLQAFFVHLFHPLGNAYCMSYIRIFLEFYGVYS